MKKKVSLAIAGSILAMATAATAGNKAQTFYVSPIIGGITYEGDQHLDTAPVYGLRVGYNFTKALAFEGLFDYSNTESTRGHGRNVDFYRYGGDFLYHFFPDNKFVPYIAAGYAGYSFKGNVPDNVANKTKGAIDYGIGAKYFLNDHIALRGDVRHIMYSPTGEYMHNIEYTVGLYVPFGGPEPTPAAAAVEPVTAALDSDKDGVPDSIDKCPGTPADVKVDKDGCPIDSDRDGVPDYLDKCPGTPEGVKVDVDGCPIDSDKDGVPDYLDKCPGTPEGVKVDKDGCPLTLVKMCTPTVLNIKFDTNKYNIKPQYNNELQKVGDFLNAYPSAKGVIEGHTDSVGNKAYNMKLSQRRADSVRNYIVKKFKVAPERIGAKGYGPTKPAASNKTKAGKQLNRRIEANFKCE